MEEVAEMAEFMAQVLYGSGTAHFGALALFVLIAVLAGWFAASTSVHGGRAPFERKM